MMKNFVKNVLRREKGFTLIEMMIVLVIISILLLIAVPNLARNQEAANDKGCEATIALIKAQKTAYEIETGTKLTSLRIIRDEKYVDTIHCPDGKLLKITDLDFVLKTIPETPDE
ncbi:MAG: prepilin-type N-terminal cleavage/methylation domain-containing protein [Bacillus sp. (in: Bacteria)]|nr:prepilin-type N-terminal cleavage/methylation domain-containing protein [Bacillus sp. (in: firmicutes)]